MFWFVRSPQKRVSLGAKWLDENQPGWAMRVDPASLDLRSRKECLLGQVYGDYYESPPIVSRSSRSRVKWSMQHGFTGGEGPNQFGSSYYDILALEREWGKVLNTRRGAEALAS